MNKPQHSPAAFRRFVQMSKKTGFILVEGKDADPFFYSQLLRPVCEATGITCDILRADFVTGTGGKQALIELHRYLASTGSLIWQDGGTWKWCIFYLDKDVDDVMHNLVDSKHIVYTPFYCVENLLFVYGELVSAAAAASSLDPQDIRERIPNREEWLRQAAGNWKEFLVLSLLSHRLAVNCECHYGRSTSPINLPPDAPTSGARFDQIKAELRTRSGLNEKAFDTKVRAVTRYVECVYRKGLHDVLFNGKWYYELLRREINIAAGGKKYSNPPNAALTAALSLTINFEHPWSGHFREPIRELVKTVDSISN